MEPKVDVSFEFAKIYDVQTQLDVVLGQKFTVFTNFEGPGQWFANNDPVLKLDANGNNCGFETTALGKSIVRLMNEEVTVKKLTINVVEAIVEPAATLGTIAGAAVAKTPAEPVEQN